MLAGDTAVSYTHLRLKHQRGAADGKGGNEHDNELGSSDPHGVGQQLGIREIHFNQHIARCAEQNEDH